MRLDEFLTNGTRRDPENKNKKREEREMKLWHMIVIGGTIIGGVIAGYTLVAYIVVHFVVKFW